MTRFRTLAAGAALLTTLAVALVMSGPAVHADPPPEPATTDLNEADALRDDSAAELATADFMLTATQGAWTDTYNLYYDHCYALMSPTARATVEAWLALAYDRLANETDGAAYWYATADYDNWVGVGEDISAHAWYDATIWFMSDDWSTLAIGHFNDAINESVCAEDRCETAAGYLIEAHGVLNQYWFPGGGGGGGGCGE